MKKQIVAAAFCVFAFGATAQEGGPGGQPPPRPIAPLEGLNGRLNLLYGNGLNLSGGALVLGAPTATVLGGIYSATAPTNQFQTGNSAGVPTFRQPSFTDLLGTLQATQMPALTGDVSTALGSTATTINPGVVTAGKMAAGAAYGNLGVNSVDYTRLTQAPAATFSGNPTGASANRQDMSPTVATSLLNPMGGDTGSGGVKGLVPAAPAGSGASGLFLGGDGTFKAFPLPCPRIETFGGRGDGTSLNDTALTSALASFGNNDACVAFGLGTYKFSAQFVYALKTASQAVTIMGAGSENTELRWDGGGGLQLNFQGAYNSLHLRDMTLTTGTAGTGNGIVLNQTQPIVAPAYNALNDITNVTLRGADGFNQTFYWTTAITAHAVNNINFTNVYVSGPAPTASGYSNKGTGVYVYGDNATNYFAVVYNFQGCTFNLLNTGILYGAYVQGMTVNQSNFVGNGVGINAPVNEPALAQLTVTGSQFNNTGNIVVNSDLPAMTVVGNYFLSPSNSTSVYMGHAVDLTYVGNVTTPASAGGINGIVLGQSNGATVIGNVFQGMAAGVVLQSTASNITVALNRYPSTTTSVSNAGTGNSVGVITP